MRSATCYCYHYMGSVANSIIIIVSSSSCHIEIFISMIIIMGNIIIIIIIIVLSLSDYWCVTIIITITIIIIIIICNKPVHYCHLSLHANVIKTMNVLSLILFPDGGHFHFAFHFNLQLTRCRKISVGPKSFRWGTYMWCSLKVSQFWPFIMDFNYLPTDIYFPKIKMEDAERHEDSSWLTNIL